jgi:hypothetical protein
MRIELRSKLIEAASYEDEAGRMRLYLTNGQLREYVQVPRSVFDGLVAARSAGDYFIKHIRGQFSHPD